ncbi:hypothetical protein F444_22833 [Phytophthora nicotianae P1976]|uniref:Uncharacterized protein n=1 Tax=Phytophthora nicotianae P1976 TaxID=1317066 RepID=A0A080YWM5_PHYNI|nr:hypothetical protein F444_22833 [Phytophthora nicotianae P1976]
MSEPDQSAPPYRTMGVLIMCSAVSVTVSSPCLLLFWTIHCYMSNFISLPVNFAKPGQARSRGFGKLIPKFGGSTNSPAVDRCTFVVPFVCGVATSGAGVA